mmetsp:Transcript_30720/g.59916  ORF Transcript_30720/g.59916 Transcript_30720/m.59916 type:complete len:4305 (+) Transcript_30720:116-13030(+)|eukprot:CAMPEP_0175123532 /NCGR_PEP_ID=MMETSP0087-20121206/2296_1 /TAXON_ID=136419 /ORGANISM="Unknown Unknown, Strain D1" /LENGTH=4304 /DNA_ID=CAMNT_0016405235 /DNA_START=114 /DNA_END=13028 /DNA_ORIENTATION=-
MDPLNSLEKAAAANHLKNIYAGAADPQEMYGNEDITPVPPGQQSRGAEEPSWRSRVADDFVKRRQTPAQARKNTERLQKKMAVVMPIRLPKLPSTDSPSNGRRKKPSPTNSSSRPGSADGQKRQKTDSKRSRVKNILANHKGAGEGVAISYTMAPPNPADLYQTEISELEKLPLELFDNDESDRTPEEWVQLGVDKYDGKGTPARSLYFLNRAWEWSPCRVLSYDAATRDFTIEFTNTLQKKLVPRLSVLFDDEDEYRFRDRKEKCRLLREQNLALRRYTAYVDSQPQSMFSPIQQTALHGIVSKLMRNSHDLVMSRQRTVEGLLIEVRDEYSRAMKQAIIDFKRKDPSEDAKMADLNLPPVREDAAVPYLAVIATPEHELPIKRMINVVERMHFAVHPEATQVILALYRSWDNLKSERCLDTDHVNSIKLPMTLYEYQDHQETHFVNLHGKIVNDWRALVVNLIRDNLTNVFQLFVNDQDEYNASELKRFLKMVTFMLRFQLASLVTESINEYVEMFKVYENPLPEEDVKEDDDMDLDADAAEDSEKNILNGYLGRPLLAAETDPARSNTQFVEPMFLFKMSTQNNKIIFLPDLNSIEVSIMSLINLPGKIQNISQIDNEVVPLLGINDVPLCTKENVPSIFDLTKEAKERLAKAIAENLRQPRALAALYQQYGLVLEIDPDDYVRKWFPTKDEIRQLRKDQRKAEREAAKAANKQPGDDEDSDDDIAYAEEEEEEEDEEPDENIPNQLHTVEETRDEIQKFVNYAEEVQNISPTEVSFRLIKIELHMVKEQLISKAKLIAMKLQEGLAKSIEQNNRAIEAEFEEMLTRIKTRSMNVEELADLKTRSRQIETQDIPRLQGELANMQANLRILDHFQFDITREEFELSWTVRQYPQNVVDAMEDTKMQIEMDNAKFQKQLQEEQAIFAQDLEEYTKEVEIFNTFGTGTPTQMEQYAMKVETLNEKLEKAEKLVQSFNQRDVLFGDMPMEYTELADLRARFRPFFQLWSTTSAFNASHSLWMTGPFIELDSNQISEDIDKWLKLMRSLEKELSADGAIKPAKVASEMKEKIQDFKQHVPVIQYLRSPGLRPRHWDQISNTLAPGRVTLTPDNDLSLSQILNFDVAKHREAIEEICTCAGKEHQLEESLDKMQKEWSDMNMILEDHKATKTYIMKGSDDILALLDDQIMKTQTMRGSPYVKPFEVRTKKWEIRLQLMSDIMEEWLACQKTWIYLEPIFSSEDIMRQLPIEGTRFTVVDTAWRNTMDAAKKNPNILEFISDTDNLLKTFQDANKFLDTIGKGLNLYLDAKRLAFPRFYFLSNDELLSILSQTKNVLAVQPHMSKCFDAVQSLNFTNETNIITGMNSAEGELVNFHTRIDPNEGPKKGNVEVWLREVELVIFACLRQLTRKALGYYVQTTREKWILEQPGQIVLSISQLFFTREVTFAMNEKGNKGLHEFLDVINSQLEKLVILVRGDLSKLNRQTLGALTVLDVHARDVIAKMAKDGVEHAGDFEWLAQLRYYWESDGKNCPGLGKTGLENEVPLEAPAGSQYNVPDGILKARMVNAEQLYGYEYLGNSERLVITPLTDRCYRTLIGAVHLKMGGAPEGPAGTGKTETVKDLGKAMAIQTVVINGSDGLNYKSMAKIFKGLAATGAWVCFDEFNRIPLEVLSVVAQQVQVIQRAVLDGKTSFFFDDQTLPLVHTVSIFITMNPGYAGRAELPDNLKVLFRTVAMMIPDYAMIAEIVLFSFGYAKAKVMGVKVVASLQLGSEQLSSQDHYDFGMRCLFSILSAAGKLRLASPEVPEEALCLRAIGDCNLPKFVSDDLPLFNGITMDLFPGVKSHATDQTQLIKAIKKSCVEQKLQRHEPFIQKVVELYDTMMVRHGLMIVGEGYSGKSSSLNVLRRASIMLTGVGLFDDVQTMYLNPKSVTLPQLYGADDPNTHEWTDGILAVGMRNMCQLPERTWKWIVFDGPVDAIWIENMNTVLDNNKKLCLASGEQIKLVNRMSTIFEVQDLAVASPATVSRCGMVFMEPKTLGWRPIYQSWKYTLPKHFVETYGEQLDGLYNWLVPVSLEYIRKKCKFVIPTSQLSMVADLCNILGSLLDDWLKAEKDPKNLGASAPQIIECFFLFSLVWSIGSGTDKAGQTRFNQFFRDIISGVEVEGFPVTEEQKELKVKMPFPPPDPKLAEPHTVYDYVYDKDKGFWEHWNQTVKPYKVPEGSAFASIIVPTVDIIRLSSVLDLLIKHNKHILLTGDTGTGKSVSINNKLLADLKGTKYIPMMLSFSAQTSANMTMDIIDGKLDRRRVGVYGPPPGKQCCVFVDDLNMPALEEYGAQPPIELLRQWMDYQGWYDVKTLTFKKLVDMQFIAAMGPPGGGRNPVTVRYLRHFNSICLVPYTNNSLKQIFATIMDFWMSSFTSKIRGLKNSLVDAVVDMYDSIGKGLLPTPAKSHYTFNLRDVAKVFQGIMQIAPEKILEPNDLIRIWSHEASRVFCDRLVSDTDINWFKDCLAKQCKTSFNTNYDAVLGEADRSLIYADFGDPKAVTRQYSEILDTDELTTVCENYLQDYNGVEKNPMHLVLFTAAVEHISRISRVIRQPLGNALLVGVGGSGRQSLTRLAAFIPEYDIFQIELTKSYQVADWKEDLRSMMRTAGVQNKPVVFLFTDTQIKDDSFLEDINNILNNGEVPNLFPTEELMPIIEEIRGDARKAGKAENPNQIYSYFVDRCRQNVHCVLCFSPVSDEFRTRLRMFPSLVNCTTIDWFHPWPTSALKSVATMFLKDVPIEDTVKTGVVDVCVDMQERVVQTTQEYYDSLRRYNYVTPTSYLELIKMFKNLFEAKRNEIGGAKERYENGLTKLAETSVQVKTMSVQLTALQPQLEKSSIETAELMVVIEKRSKEVAITAEKVGVEEAACNVQAAEATAIKEECEAGLAEALPALESAVKALNTLKKADFDEMKGMKVPTPGILLTVEAMCTMLSIKPAKKGEVGAKVDDYWEPAKKVMLPDPKLLEKLKNYDKDNIKPAIMQKIRDKFAKNEAFQPAAVAKASKAAEGMCKWVLAMEIYDRVAKQIAPKRAALKEAEETYAKATAELAVKKAQLKEVQDLLDDLNSQFELTNKKKETLANEVKECSDRLKRAEQLLGGLSGEKDRWLEKATQLGKDYENVVGNILVSSGVVAYLGVFTSELRESCINSWINLLAVKNISSSPEFRLHKILGDPVMIRAWGIQGLPNDDFSIDNGVILNKSLRWGLMIDPQEQANKWIKKMEEESQQLKVIKPTDDQFIRILSTAIQVGLPVLIENVTEQLDPALDPLLLKQTYKQGSRLMIRIGAEVLEYSSEFRLYLTTKLQNPHYSPETTTKVTLINFMVTPSGLQDQMLGKVVGLEQPKLEAERGELIVKSAENARQLQMIEDKILHHLNESKGNILDDEDLIETLNKSKQASKLIEKRVQAAAKTQEEIANVRLEYKPVAFQTSNLFFAIFPLCNVDPMYQYSLDWFIDLFCRAVKDADTNDDIHVRVHNINKTFLFSLYNNVCRSLFEKDKLLFSFMLTCKLLAGAGKLNQLELRFILTGSAGGIVEAVTSNPCDDFEFDSGDGDEEKPPIEEGSKWLPDPAWGLVTRVSKVSEVFAGFDEDFLANQREWRAYYECADPLSTPFPGKWDKELSTFSKLLIVRCLRPEKMLPYIADLVAKEIGPEFCKPPPFDLAGAYPDSSSSQPIIFVLSPGVDPTSKVFDFASTKGMDGPDRLISISLGQGQGPFAETAIKEAMDKGTWVLLQNCHLLVSWMPALQKLVEDINPLTCNPEFRLWLTAAPSDDFPVPILQNGVKLTNEPPKGIKANLAAKYAEMEDSWFEDCKKPEECKKLLFGLTFFHALVLERKKFGPMGWNVIYGFTDSDMLISKRQLKMFLNTYEETPIVALRYLVGQLNYGGRVTDEWDLRTLNMILNDMFCEQILGDEYVFTSGGEYHAPVAGADCDDMRQYINDLPAVDDCEVFGLHDNVNITAAIVETTQFCDTMLLVQPRQTGAGGGMSRDEVIDSIAKDIQGKLPANFDVEEAQKKYPVVYENSMNTVLCQELGRFNKLLKVVKTSLVDIQRAIKGEVVMSEALELLADSFFNGKVPTMWSKAAYPSLKPLSGWVTDLIQRLQMFTTWIEKGAPGCYWMSGFFFTQSFLTGTMQNYARKYSIAIDELGLDFEVMAHIDPEKTEPPKDGCYIHGLFLEGSRWCTKTNAIAEPYKRQLTSIFPVIWFKPQEKKKIPTNKLVYPCPVYKESKRAGILTTTGKSSNYVLPIMLPSTKHESHWVKRGVAFLCQLND